MPASRGALSRGALSRSLVAGNFVIRLRYQVDGLGSTAHVLVTRAGRGLAGRIVRRLVRNFGRVPRVYLGRAPGVYLGRVPGFSRSLAPVRAVSEVGVPADGDVAGLAAGSRQAKL